MSKYQGNGETLKAEQDHEQIINKQRKRMLCVPHDTRPSQAPHIRRHSQPQKIRARRVLVLSMRQAPQRQQIRRAL